MKRFLSLFLKYWAVFKINFLMTTSYKPLLVGRLPLFILTIFLIAQLYSATYTNANQEFINGLNYIQTVWILVFVQAFYMSTAKNITKTITTEIVSGSLVYFINKPYSYILFHLFSFLGQLFPTLAISILAGTIITYLITGVIPFTLAKFALCAIAILLGFILSFFILCLMGLAAFWLSNTEPLEWIMSKIIAVFGGSIVPIAFFTGNLKIIADLLPFNLLFYGPAKLLMDFSVTYFLQTLFLQLTWLLIFFFFSKFVFNRGVRNVSIGGS